LRRWDNRTGQFDGGKTRIAIIEKNMRAGISEEMPAFPPGIPAFRGEKPYFLIQILSDVQIAAAACGTHGRLSESSQYE
jgi:hypothetical protein